MTHVGLDNAGIPPGIDDSQNLERYASGGDENAWLYFSKTRYYTNAFVVEDGKVELCFYSRSKLNLKEAFSSCFLKVTFRIEETGLWDEQVSLLPCFRYFLVYQTLDFISFTRYNGFGEDNSRSTMIFNRDLLRRKSRTWRDTSGSSWTRTRGQHPFTLFHEVH